MPFLDVIRSRPRRRAIGIGLLRTTPFIAAGVLSLILHYSAQETFQFRWDREPMIFFVFILLCWTVFYAVSHRLPFTTDDIIEDLLVAAGRAYGGGYRLNIMCLISLDPAFNSYFKITHSFNIADISVYRQNIKEDIPGAGQAYKYNRTTYITGQDLRSDLDPYPKHIWSTPIRHLTGKSVGLPIAVLNVDCNHADSKTDAEIQSTKTSIEKLARLIEDYHEELA